MRKLTVAAAILALVPFAVAACGGDDDDSGAPPPAPEAQEPAPDPDASADPETVRVSADPGGSPAFEQDRLEAPVGEVTFEFENPATTGHDFVIEDADGSEIGRTDVIADASDSLTVELEPGEYTFYCSVPGHREGGMVGALTVGGDQGGAGDPDPPGEVPGY